MHRHRRIYQHIFTVYVYKSHLNITPFGPIPICLSRLYICPHILATLIKHAVQIITQSHAPHFILMRHWRELGSIPLDNDATTCRLGVGIALGFANVERVPLNIIHPSASRGFDVMIGRVLLPV